MTRPSPSVSMNHLTNALTQLDQVRPSLPCRVLAYRESVPTGLCGSYVSLSGCGSEHIIGLLSHPLAWEVLGRALDADAPRPEPRGLVEGACELSRLIAEAFKRRLPCTETVVGVPLFADGAVSSGRRVELQAADVSLAGTLVLVVLFSRVVPEVLQRSGVPSHGREVV